MPANETGRIHAENRLMAPGLDFSAAYMGVRYLAGHIKDHPETITPKTIDALAHILESKGFARQKQVLFLYREAAQAMVIMAGSPTTPISRTIVPRLMDLLPSSRGKRLRALSQALGRLPVTLSGPVPDIAPDRPMAIGLDTLASSLGLGPGPEFFWKGRSLVIRDRKGRTGVVKFATSPANIQGLIREIQWMSFLNTTVSCRKQALAFPTPFMMGDSILFKLDLNLLPKGGPDTLYRGVCIAYLPCPGYFDYPNEGPRPRDQIKGIFFKNARLLGTLARQGIFHTALIPLFHNRVQQGRRNDNGAYLWEHGGRLDQWLDSCRYPNFAASGLRDFEHLIRAQTNCQLGHYVGEHLLSFILVMGSYFRNQNPDRRGVDEKGAPLDTRDLFSFSLFLELLTGVFRAYFTGLVQEEPDRAFEADLSGLVKDLIRVMGEDRHMEEVLRIQDQNAMDQTEFERFLRDRGVRRIPAKGRGEIVLTTGPHLGGFNQAISVPELIDTLFRFSALCVSHCFLKEQATGHAQT